MLSEKSVIVESNIPQEAVAGLASFFERYYASPNWRFIERDSYRKTETNGIFTISWNLNVHQNGQFVSLYCYLKISQPSVEITFQNLEEGNQVQSAVCDRTVDEIQNIVSSYLLHTKMSNLYFVIGANDEKHSEAPPQEGNTQRGILRRILSGSSTNVFLIFTLASFILLFTIGAIALFFLLAIQFVYLFYSDRVMLNTGNVHPSSERPFVSIVSLRSTPETLKNLRQHGKKILKEIREDVSKLQVTVSTSSDESTLAESNQNVKTSILSILSRYGISVALSDMEVRTRNVYEIVKNVASKFNQPIPKIVMVNSVISNAAATGISKNRSSIMITAGSLEDLSDKELETMIGHELGHVKGHDPLILFGITSFQFVGMFYLWYPLVLFLGFIYFILAFGAIFAVGKILETRADTESAIMLGDPSAFAMSLRKIGFRELYREKYSPFVRLLDWFRFDPHPPTYFRVSRMSEFIDKDKSRTKHTFLISLRDCIVGFFSAF